MADSKKYYWLKLKRDFFKRHDIRIIEEMPNGKDYILFYLKLLLESIDHDGELRFSEAIPYDEQMLSVITNTNIDIVRSAMKMFVELKMIEVLDDCTIFMSEIQRLIGGETKGAERVRRYRQTPKALHCNTDVQLCNENVQNCNTEIEKEIEIELDKETDKEIVSPVGESAPRINYQSIVDEFNNTCVSLPKVREISDKRKKAIKALSETVDKHGGFTELFKKTEASDFLTGRTGKWDGCSFDWLMNKANAVKVLEGNYDNKKSKSEPDYTDTSRYKEASW